MLIKQGDSGEAVKELQRALVRDAFVLDVDGVFGPLTQLAVESFQNRTNITPDGIVGPLTAAKLGLGSQVQAPSGGTCKIIDVSHWEPSIAYDKVAAAGYAGVIAKCTEGTGYFDASFDYHRKGAKAAGLSFAHYHFMRYGMGGVEQAHFYLKHAIGSSLYIADCEWADGKVQLGEDGATILLDFLHEVERQTGKTPWIYTSAGFFYGFSNPERFAKYPLWIAAYTATLHKPLPAPFKDAIAWQYQYDPQQKTPVEVVPGAGKIDVSTFYGSAAEFAALCKT